MFLVSLTCVEWFLIAARFAMTRYNEYLNRKDEFLALTE